MEQMKKDFEELKDKLITLLGELGDKDIDLKLEHYVQKEFHLLYIRIKKLIWYVKIVWME